MKARQPGHIWSDMGPGLQMALRDAWRADIFKGATSSSTSLLPRVGDQIFSVLKLLCLLFQVIQELLPSKGACGRLGGLILLPQARGQQCILQWWLRGGCRERERGRERERAVSCRRLAFLQKLLLEPRELHLSGSLTGKETNTLGGAGTGRGHGETQEVTADRGRAQLGLSSRNQTRSQSGTFYKGMRVRVSCPGARHSRGLPEHLLRGK